MEEAIAILQEEGVISGKDCLERRKTNSRLQQLPASLHNAYRPYFSWSKVTGRNKRVTAEEMLSMKEAIAILRREGATSQKDYLEKRKTNPRLQHLPTGLYQIYPGFSWHLVTGRPYNLH